MRSERLRGSIEGQTRYLISESILKIENENRNRRSLPSRSPVREYYKITFHNNIMLN